MSLKAAISLSLDIKWGSDSGVYFARSHLGLSHRPLSADALPQATSPNYLALGLAIRDTPAVAFLVTSELAVGVLPRDSVPWPMVCRSLRNWTTDFFFFFFFNSPTVKKLSVKNCQVTCSCRCDLHELVTGSVAFNTVVFSVLKCARLSPCKHVMTL